jgi:hypothetical protein
LKNQSKSRVLADHQRKGKRFIPPWTQQFGTFQETPWAAITMPELIWIAFLHVNEGYSQGTALAASLSKAALRKVPRSKTWFAAVSSYDQLNSDLASSVLNELNSKTIQGLQRSLTPLQHFYPECPLRFLFNEGVPEIEDPSAILRALKNTVSTLHDKTTREAILMQGTAIYLGFVNNRLKVAKETSLAEFPELERYPRTKKSRMIAAAVRSMTPMVVRHQDEPYETQWARYFWNRGLEIDSCTLEP